jgi:hypothetical protein
MSKPATLLAILALTFGAAAAMASEADGNEAAAARPSDVLQFEVRDQVAVARAAGTWPQRDYDAMPAWHKPKASHSRKQYPNVMGVRFADWLAAHEAARDAGERTPEAN